MGRKRAEVKNGPKCVEMWARNGEFFLLLWRHGGDVPTWWRRGKKQAPGRA